MHFTNKVNLVWKSRPYTEIGILGILLPISAYPLHDSHEMLHKIYLKIKLENCVCLLTFPVRVMGKFYLIVSS